MSNASKVKELMVEITEYPHIPYWLSVRDAISIIHSIYGETRGREEAPMVLVFDERYQLQGILTRKNLLKGIEPRLRKKDKRLHYQGLTREDYAGLSVLVEGTFSEKCREEARKPVCEVMTPIRAEVEVNDSVAKAAFVMLHANVNLVPVMDGEKIKGLLRMSDVFDELAKIVL